MRAGGPQPYATINVVGSERAGFETFLSAQSKVILGIESSCDETAAAVVSGGERILSSIVASQIAIHRK